MPIWFDTFPLASANARNAGCGNSHLGIELIEAGDDGVRRMRWIPRATTASARRW
jgi:ribosomal protein L22